MALLPLTEEIKADALAAFKPSRCITTAAASHSRMSGAVMVRLFTILLVVMPQAGCAHRPVNGMVKPTHFAFVTITPQRKRGPGGWRAACIHAQINHGNSGDSYICKFGVEMPIENAKNGPISDADAQETAATCANNAAYTVLVGMTEPTPPPLYTLCTNIRNKYRELLDDAIEGSRVLPTCDAKTKPVVFGVDAPF